MGKFSEAPVLATLVQEGKLPPVEERLPPDPLVIEPIESIGQYGGTATMFGWYATYPQVYTSENFIGWEPILRANRDMSYAQPNIADAYEFSNDGKTMTIHLHPGIRWSDGEPFTADDVVFYFEHQAPYNDLNPVPPDSWIFGGELATAEKVDDYTVKLHAVAPMYIIVNAMSHANGAQPGIWIGFFQAEHYAKQFHADFIGLDAAEAKAAELGYSSWQEMYRERTQSCYGIQIQPDVAPTLTAYILVERTPSRWVWERNPYYWKVDPQGQQLPYIDRLVVNLIGADQQTLNGRIITGEADWANGALQDMSLYVDNRAKVGYKIVQLRDTGIAGLELNLTAEDRGLRALFQDVRFRKAMSLAINREEIIDLVYLGLAKPAGYYADPSSPYYEEEYAKMADEFAVYDPDQANALLDQVGLTQRGPDGFRRRPDGSQLQIVYEYVGETVTEQVELLVDYWRQIGIEVLPKPQTFELLSERIVANQVQLANAQPVSGLEPLFVDHPHPVVPYDWSWIGTWGLRWAQYRTTGGQQGEKPPQYIQQLFDWWNVMRTEDAAARVEAGKNIFREHAEMHLKIGLYTQPPVVRIVAGDLYNYPWEGAAYNVWNWMRSMPFDPPQMYFDGRPSITDPSPLIWDPYGEME